MKKLLLLNLFRTVILCSMICFINTSHAQMDQLVNTVGQYQIRADACGTLSAGCDITIEKPTDATTVFAVYVYYTTMAAASMDFGEDAISMSGGGLIAGPVSMTNLTNSPVFGDDVFTRYENVTATFAPGLDAAIAGTNIIYTTTESSTSNIEGTGIVVIWNNPTVVNTAIHLSLGSLNTGVLKADSIAIAPIDTSVPDFAATLGVGTVYSVGDALQRSTVWVNGAVLDDYVGGYEDGALANGALMTLGGYGDGLGLDDEDELFDFSGFISDGDTQVKYEIMTSTSHDLDWFNALYFEIVAANPPSDTSICLGDSIFIGGDYQTIAGTYVDSLTDMAGLDSIVSTILTIVSPPDVDAGVDTVSCGLTFTLNGDSGAGVGTWSGAVGTIFSDEFDDNSEVSVPDIGVYEFYLTSENALGCSNTDSVIVTFSNLSIESDSTKLCNGIADGEITVISDGSIGVITYAWDAAAGFQITNPAVDLIAGNYNVVLTDGLGCTIDSTFTINDPLPFVYTTDSLGSSCGLPNGSVEVIGFAGGTGGYTYDWGTGPVASAVSTGLLAGVYSVTVADDNSCDTTIAIEVTTDLDFVPTISSFTNVTCNGVMDGTATANGSDFFGVYSFLWDAAAGNQTTQTATGLGAGTYQVYVTDDISGCFDSVTVVITEPTALTVDAGIDLDVCEGEVLTFSGNAFGGTPGYTYVWNNAVLDGIPFNSSIFGVYEVTVTDANGCTAIDDRFLTGYIPASPTFTVNNLPCEFTSEFQNTSTGGAVACIWTINGEEFNTCGDINYVFPGAGSYDVGLTVTTIDGCTSSVEYADYISFNPLPEAAFSPLSIEVPETSPLVDFVNASSNAIAYLWSFGDNIPTSTEVSPSIEFPRDVAGDYIIELTAISADNCVDKSTALVRVLEETIFYVPNTFTPDGDQFNERFQPVFTSGFDPANFTLLIFNRWGEVVFESHDASIGWDGTYGGEIAESEMYIWSISFKSSDSDKRTMEKGHVFLLK